jgi:hypothetical protein
MHCGVVAVSRQVQSLEAGRCTVAWLQSAGRCSPRRLADALWRGCSQRAGRYSTRARLVLVRGQRECFRHVTPGYSPMSPHDVKHASYAAWLASLHLMENASGVKNAVEV